MWPVRFLFKDPSFVFHIFIVRSEDPVAKSPLGKTAKQFTPPKCPLRVVFMLPSIGFHIFTVWSSEALTKSPLGKTTSDQTLFQVDKPERIK